MKEFFIKVSSNPTYKKIMKQPLTYVAGAVLLAVLNTAHFVTMESGWGVSTAFAHWGGWLYELFGGDVSSWVFFSTDKASAAMEGGFLNDAGSIRNVGIIFGALLAALFASEFKIKKIKAPRQVVAAVLGGLLMGIGARLANGCNIGGLFTAASAMSLSGWIFGAFLVVGAFFGGKLLMKYFM